MLYPAYPLELERRREGGHRRSYGLFDKPTRKNRKGNPSAPDRSALAQRRHLHAAEYLCQYRDNVSVLFIDKANTEGKVILVDAARLGEKRDDGGNQRTVLSESEIAKIEDTFIHQEEIEDFSILVTADQIKERNYSFAAGQYFPVKIEYVDISEEEFIHKIATYQEQLKSCFIKGKELEDEIRKALKDLKYEN